MWASVLAAFGATAASAGAYFTTGGSGQAGASVTSLGVPVLDALAGAGIVTLSWTPATAPGGSPQVGYYVTGADGSAIPGCGSPEAPIAATSCVHDGAAVGAHRYVLQAVWRSWSTASAPAAATVSSGPLHHLAVAAGAEQLAGAPFTVRLTAQDAAGRTVTSYAGAKSVAWSGGEPSPNATAPTYPASSVQFTAGVSDALPVTLVAAGSATLSAAASGAAGSITVAVAPAAAAALAVAAPASADAGSSFTVKLTARDRYGNVATGFEGTRTVAWGGASASPSGKAPSYPETSAAFSAGVSTSNLSATLYSAGGNALTADAGGGVTGSAAVSVTPLAPTTMKLGQCLVNNVARTCASAFSGIGLLGTLKANIDVLDAYGNVPPVTSRITISLANSNALGFSATSSVAVEPTGAPANRSTQLTVTALLVGSTTITASGPGLASLAFTVSS